MTRSPLRILLYRVSDWHLPGVRVPDIPVSWGRSLCCLLLS